MTRAWAVLEFYRYRRILVGAGPGNRLMWGPGQKIWPGAIDRGLEAIREGAFLSAGQQRDFLYQKAAGLLRWYRRPIG